MPLRQVRSDEVTPTEWDRIKAIFEAAFAEDGFPAEEWEHLRPGVHFLFDVDGEIVSHASVVERDLHAGALEILTGYVEAVATWPPEQGKGHGTTVMREVTRHISETYRLGALGTDLFSFYGRLGWVRWRGPLYLRTDDGPVRTEEDEGYVMVLRTPTSPPLGLDEPLSCNWRPGDVW
jgi:aminoglycoside 2'-N-acetyltransferase I